MKVRIEFEPRDIWIGVFWRKQARLTLWICIVPMFPIIVTL